MDPTSLGAETKFAESQSEDKNVTGTSSDGVPPPSQDMIKTQLDSGAVPGDSPPLPTGQVELINDGIADQQSRRKYRTFILTAALMVLALFALSLTGIVGTLGAAFYQALKPENIAKFVAVELQEKIGHASLQSAEKLNPTSTSPKASKNADEETKASKVKSTASSTPTKENDPIKVEAKIYGEIRDSMVPLVALVSILTVAIVVILGTMLKAVFAPHPNHRLDMKENEEASPLPIIEALKGLVDSIKAVWK